MIEVNRQGCTRIVILTKRKAFKIPNFLSGFRMLLEGFLANDQERVWGKVGYDGFCPLLFSLPCGLLVVMPKVEVMSPDEFLLFDYESFVERGDYLIPVERKWNSFGRLNGEVVAIDYGN